MTFCEEVRIESDPFWQGSFDHPFIRGLADGSLPVETFRKYIMQDSYYLSHFSKLQALAAIKSTDFNTTQRFLIHAEQTCQAELSLHQSFFEMLDITDEEWHDFKPSPSAYNYVTHMYYAAGQGELADALAAILPCYWLYFEIGERLRTAKPNHPIYDKWIETYGSVWFGDLVREQIERMNHLAAKVTNEKYEQLKELFIKSSYYEWHFWEMAWQNQQWSIPELLLEGESIQ